ncbi:MAG: hypothetical protein NTY22_04295, partial [Proteobacteria bacterium]|nr:hypothetical protein [Pseudomonadota bacterium]
MFFIIVYNIVLNISLANHRVELENKIKIAFPDKDKKSRDTLIEDSAKLSTEIQNRMRSTKVLVEGEIPKKDSAIDVLMNLSETIPKDITVDI